MIFIKNKYKRLYINIIKNAILGDRTKLAITNTNYIYYENHHIFPVSIFPRLQHDKKFQVLLTGKEHFIVHHLLTKFTIGVPLYKMQMAYVNMTYSSKNNDGRYKVNSSQFSQIRKQSAIAHSNYLRSNEYRIRKGIEASSKMIKTRNDPVWKETIGYNGIRKYKETVNNPVWKETTGKIRSNKHSETKHNQHWKETTGFNQIENFKSTVNELGWKETIGKEKTKNRLDTISSSEYKRTKGKDAINKYKQTIRTSKGKQIQIKKGELISEILNSDSYKQSHTKTCPYCSKTIKSPGNYVRWHDINCKEYQ